LAARQLLANIGRIADISSERVTVEEAPVQFLVQKPLLHQPNEITPALNRSDAAYFASKWDNTISPLKRRSGRKSLKPQHAL